MRAIGTAVAVILVSASLANAQEKVFGEIGLTLGRSNVDDIDEGVSYSQLHGGAAFVSAAGLGIQLDFDSYYAEADGLGSIDGGSFNTHIYGDLGYAKLGVFSGSTTLGSVDVYDVGATDVNETVWSYGFAGQGTTGNYSYSGYLGTADVDGLDDADVIIYGLGGEYDVSSAFELAANFDGISISPDGVEDSIDLTSFEVGANYYVTAGRAPLRLSAGLARSGISYGDDDFGATTVNVGATLLLGGARGSEREDLFDTFSADY